MKRDSVEGDSFVLWRAFCSAVNIPLIVLHSLVISVLWSKFSTKSLNFCRLCSQISGCLYSVLAVQARCGLFCGGRLVWSSRPVSLLVHVPRGVCVVQ